MKPSFFLAALGPPCDSGIISAFDFLTSLWCCLVATVRPWDITPVPLSPPSHVCRLEKGGVEAREGKRRNRWKRVDISCLCRTGMEQQKKLNRRAYS